MKYFSADIHDFHANVIRFCNRPFKDVNEMHEHIVKEFGKLTANDELYILGDEAMNMRVSLLMPSYTKAKVHLIVGNHSSCFKFHLKSSRMKKRQAYLDAGYASVMHEDTTNLKGYGNVVKLSHFPYRNEEIEKNYDDRFLEFRPKNDGLFLLHGHMHCHYVKFNNMIDVGFDNNFTFYSEKDVVELIKDPRTFIPSRLTDFYKQNGGYLNEKQDDL